MKGCSWEKIVKDNTSIVWQSAYRLLGNSADTQECFQNTFISALEVSRRQKVRNFRALLLYLSTRRAIDLLRRRQNKMQLHTVKTDVEILPLPRPGPLQQLQADELIENLRKALSNLPSQQAEAFCLRILNDMSNKEIAKQLDIKANAVGVLLHRAKNRLREIMKSYDYEKSEVYYEKK